MSEKITAPELTEDEIRLFEDLLSNKDMTFQSLASNAEIFLNN